MNGVQGGGQISADDRARVSLLEQFMPRFDTRLQQAIEVHAPAQSVFTAVVAVTAKEVRFLRELEFIRALPGLAATGRLDAPTVDAPLILIFTRGAVLLGARPPQEVLAGAIGCFWRLAGNEPVVCGSPEESSPSLSPGSPRPLSGSDSIRRRASLPESDPESTHNPRTRTAVPSSASQR